MLEKQSMSLSRGDADVPQTLQSTEVTELQLYGNKTEALVQREIRHRCTFAEK